MCVCVCSINVIQQKCSCRLREKPKASRVTETNGSRSTLCAEGTGGPDFAGGDIPIGLNHGFLVS